MDTPRELINQAHIIYKNLISPLGFSLTQSFLEMRNGKSGIAYHENIPFVEGGLYAAIINETLIDTVFSKYGNPKGYTKLEKLSIISIQQAIDETFVDVNSKKTLLIYATTKGNAEVQPIDDTNKTKVPNQFLLLEFVNVLEHYFKFENTPVILSNACVSGTQAIILAAQFVESGVYDDVIVVGGDSVSSFTLTGFKALNALSDSRCQPFDKNRKGINLGECCACLIISNCKDRNKNYSKVLRGSSTLDAHHIVAPSKHGTGLTKAIENCISTLSTPIDFIAAHGTATIYNDEMEALALVNNGLNDVPVFSIKGYFGHTLGAAGILETLIALKCLETQLVIPSLGFAENGVSHDIYVTKELLHKKSKTFLKTASGFGGVNSAIVIG